MSDRDKDRWLDAKIEQQIRQMSEESVPVDFSKRVMGNMEPKVPSKLLRFKLWLTGPRSLTFTPLQTIPAVACVLAVIVLGAMHLGVPVQNEGVSLISVRFVLDDSNKSARTVAVIGSFNDWKTERSVMWYDGDLRKWVLEAKLPPGDHEYMFLVDGNKLVSDPQAAMSRDDGFGNKNSILFVNGDHEQSI